MSDIIGINFSEIFPTKWNILIFILYITFFINQGILVTFSQESKNLYNYNVIVAVTFTDIVKLLICVIVYCFLNNLYAIFNQFVKHIKLLWLYFIPAFLYSLYNYFSFINLLNYDPATYYILLQLRVVLTGILFQILFEKTLTLTQWFSLILLTIGCMLKNFKFEWIFLNDQTAIFHNLNKTEFIKNDGLGFNSSSVIIFLQILCSCFAGVYCEYLLKNEGLNVNIFIQNIFMYVDSIVCNLLFFFFWDFRFFSIESLNKIFHYKVLLVIVNNAIVGIVTSFFLKYFNSIMKTIASALELVFITVLSWIFFSISVTTNTVVSIIIVSYAIFLYSKNPVQNTVLNNLNRKESTEMI